MLYHGRITHCRYLTETETSYRKAKQNKTQNNSSTLLMHFFIDINPFRNVNSTMIQHVYIIYTNIFLRIYYSSSYFY